MLQRHVGNNEDACNINISGGYNYNRTTSGSLLDAFINAACKTFPIYSKYKRMHQLCWGFACSTRAFLRDRLHKPSLFHLENRSCIVVKLFHSNGIFY